MICLLLEKAKKGDIQFLKRYKKEPKSFYIFFIFLKLNEVFIITENPFTEEDEKRAILVTKLTNGKQYDSSLHEPVKLLLNPDLFFKFVNELGKKIAGEHYTRSSIFLCSCNIWLKNSLQTTHCLINSSSSAGKDFITKNVFDIFPDQIKDYRSKITPEAFSYWRTDKKSVEDGFSWDGRLLYLEDCSQHLLDSATFRVMLSGGTHATVVRDQRAIDLRINGRPLVLVTTATTKPSNELLNRFIPISLEETGEQTANVFLKELEFAKGVKNDYDISFKKALSCLERVNVVIPFAEYLASLFPCKPVSMRREFARFLTLIQNSAALHQFQRNKDENGNVLADWFDYDLAVYCYGGFAREIVKLTKTQQRIYDCLIDGEWYYLKEISGKLGLDSTWVYRILSQLQEKELVVCKLDDTEAKSKAKHIYAKLVSHSQLPKSKELLFKINENPENLVKLANFFNTTTTSHP